MSEIYDELMDELSISSDYSCSDVFFQFGNDDPVQIATVYDGHKFSITLDDSDVESPVIQFADGKGNTFKIFMKKCF